MRRITTKLLTASAIACGAVVCTAAQAFAQGTLVMSDQPTGWVGVTLQTDTAHRGKAAAYPVVAEVVPESPADQAGLVPGDTILKYDTNDARVVSRFRQFLQPGRHIRVTVRRNDVKVLTVVVGRRSSDGDTVTMAIMPPTFNIAFGSRNLIVSTSDNDEKTKSHLVCPLTPIAGPISMSGQISFAGAALMQMNADMAQLLHVQNRGVLVVSAPEGTQARAFGLKGGDVIVMVGSSPVQTPVGVIQTISKKMQQSSSTQLTLQIVRNGQTRRIKLQR